MGGRLDIALGASLIYRGVLPIVHQFNREMPSIEIVLHELPLAEHLE